MSAPLFENTLRASRAYYLFGKDMQLGLGHAYMVISPDDEIVKEFFTLVAARMYCVSGRACMECRGCKTVLDGNNPDVFTVNPQGEKIKVQEVKDMVSSVSIKPISGVKAYFVCRADLMTQDAQNKLLKTLEEPPEGVTIFLGVANEAERRDSRRVLRRSTGKGAPHRVLARVRQPLLRRPDPAGKIKKEPRRARRRVRPIPPLGGERISESSHGGPARHHFRKGGRSPLFRGGASRQDRKAGGRVFPSCAGAVRGGGGARAGETLLLRQPDGGHRRSALRHIGGQIQMAMIVGIKFRNQNAWFGESLKSSVITTESVLYSHIKASIWFCISSNSAQRSYYRSI